MKLKDALALMKLPPVARQSIQTRMVGLLMHQQTEHRVTFERLLAQVPKHAKVGWEYRHSVLRGKRWCHAFQNTKNRWEKLMRGSSTCSEDDFDEIIAVAAYFCEDTIPRNQVLVFKPGKGKVSIWPGGSPQYQTVMKQLLGVQTDRVQRQAKEHGNLPL